MVTALSMTPFEVFTDTKRTISAAPRSTATNLPGVHHIDGALLSFNMTTELISIPDMLLKVLRFLVIAEAIFFDLTNIRMR